MLTKREKEILRLIVGEYSSKEIATGLGISLHTVESHRKNLYRKTQAAGIIGLVNYAYKHNLHKLSAKMSVQKNPCRQGLMVLCNDHSFV